MNSNNNILLQVKNLKTYFKTDEGVVKAVNGVSFDLRERETLGLVGESACGKSVTNLSIMKLIPSPPGKIAEGEIYFQGQDILKMSDQEIRDLRGNKISMIFQDPMTSLNPFLRISTQLTETIRLHQGLHKQDAYDKSIEMLKIVGIPSPEKRVDDYPHQFSGGMRQRVMIAMALSCNPRILIADEPTTALDVSIQAQILNLLKDLQNELGLAYLFIAHDLSVIEYISNRVAVMYLGKIVEISGGYDLYKTPLHPYTKALLSAAPIPDPEIEKRRKRIILTGDVPSPDTERFGCYFYDRCASRMPKCQNHIPALKSAGDGHRAACFLYFEPGE